MKEMNRKQFFIKLGKFLKSTTFKMIDRFDLSLNPIKIIIQKVGMKFHK